MHIRNRFTQGGRLTDYHKNQIEIEQLLNRLNQVAKEKVNETMIPIEELDKINQEIYMQSSEPKCTCVICGEKSSVDDSYSKRGKRWTCTSCFERLKTYLGINTIQLLDKIHREDYTNG